MAKIAGYLVSAGARILVIDESDWSLEANEVKSVGTYEITGLSSGKKSVVAVSNDGEVVGFGNIDSVA